MCRLFNTHVALIGLGLLLATSPAAAIATTPDDAPAVRGAARWLQLAIKTKPTTTPTPTIKRMDLQKRDLPKKTGGPTGPSQSHPPVRRH
jgi:DMSO/TMAO reductase YedYZ molybdopterin-dependent catalytic subunit